MLCSSQFPDVVLTFDSTSMVVHEDEGVLNLTITKQRAAAIPITVVISTQPQEAKRELMSLAFPDSYHSLIILLAICNRYTGLNFQQMRIMWHCLNQWS